MIKLKRFFTKKPTAITVTPENESEVIVGMLNHMSDISILWIEDNPMHIAMCEDFLRIKRDIQYAGDLIKGKATSNAEDDVEFGYQLLNGDSYGVCYELFACERKYSLIDTDVMGDVEVALDKALTAGMKRAEKLEDVGDCGYAWVCTDVKPTSKLGKVLQVLGFEKTRYGLQHSGISVGQSIEGSRKACVVVAKSLTKSLNVEFTVRTQYD